MNIVILDDEAIICEGLSAMLAAHGGRQWNLFAIYHDAEEALETCDWDKVDLLIADINMPGLTGLELLSTLRERGHETLVIIISGYMQFEYAQKALRHDAVDYIVKPISAEKFFMAIEKAEKKLTDRKAEKNSRIFIQNNLDRLTREYFGELLFDFDILSTDQKASLADSFGLQGRKFAIMLLYSLARRDIDSNSIENVIISEKTKVFVYRIGSGIYTILAVSEDASSIDTTFMLALAEREIGPLLWHKISRVDGLERITATYTKLLECMRDSAELSSIKPLRPIIVKVELPSAKGDYAPAVIGALNIIKLDFAKPLSLTRLSEQLFVHPTYLSNLFKKQTGMALIDYINHYRIEKAKELLADPLNKIYWVTEQAGFVNQRYFSQVFKRITGLTPVEYRTNCFIRPFEKRSED
jgi:two-component system response regulator YesN